MIKKEILPALLMALFLALLGCSQKPVQKVQNNLVPYSPPPLWLDPAWRDAQYPFEQAIADWEAVLRINPNHNDARRNLETARRQRQQRGC
ncbi:MAG: hypothetical protein LBU89_08395 [Fibromonadaceae bacterium]|jgi:hypothetical protein|nr:hypothetical protein [Fibromonadaceae bacterium]